MTTRNRRILWAAILVGGGLFLAWLLRPAAVPVEIGVVTRGTLEVTVDEEGMTRVRERYEVVAPVAGRLERIELEEGDSVRAGQVVARLFPATLDVRSREQAEARLAAARAGQSAAEAARDEAAAAHAQAGRELDRVELLAGRELVAVQELERARTEESLREAALAAARSRALAAAWEVSGARAALLYASPGAGSRGALEIRAPADGRVLRVHEQGAREVASGVPLFEFGDPATLEVVIDLLSSDAVRIAPEAEVRLVSWGGEDTLRAVVRRVEPSGYTKVSPLGVEEQRVNVVADLVAPPPGLGDRFRVDASIVTWKGGGVVKAPAGALWRSDAGWAVFAVEDGRARVRSIRAGHRGSDEVEILDGLEEGDVVVLYPGDRVAEGVRVRP